MPTEPVADVAIRLVEFPTEEQRMAVAEGLRAFNRRYMDAEVYVPVAFLVQQGDAPPRGGLVGAVYWGALYIDLLWVPDELRGQGIGTRLMAQAEAFARRYGCNFVHLDTMSFQARGFYEKVGYTVFATLTGYPNGVERYYLVKHFYPAPPARSEAAQP
jgi:GNAT superfamily N-acetyltransferase